jgi:hypothetical protein
MSAFEAMAYDADCPSMTMRFRVRPGEAPLAGGIYRIERIRTATKKDIASFGEYPDPKCYHCGKSDQDA